MRSPVQAGTLYIVSTPIGNLDDITYRAVHVLGGVDIIAAEDTRKTQILLRHIGVSKPLVSHYSYNERRRIPELLARLHEGKSIAVVTDAGTPGISDPAFALIRGAINEGIDVIPVPGASAVIPALVVSGLSTDRFVFEGFLPVKKGRRTHLDRLRDERRTIVLYESPHRIERTLVDLQESLGDRPAALARELTKKFEEVRRGHLSDLIRGVRQKPPKGEIVLVVGGYSAEEEHQSSANVFHEDQEHAQKNAEQSTS